MNQFEITVYKSDYDEDGTYRNRKEIYSQALESLDVSKLAIFLNSHEPS
jgi:hypothetical protein